MQKIIIVLFSLILLSLSACAVDDLPFIDGESTPQISFEYQPPFVPVTFIFNEKGVSVGTGVGITTPFGRFGLNADYPVADFGQVTLVFIDRNAGEQEVYHVWVEDGVQISLEGSAQLTFKPNGVLELDITDGQLTQLVLSNEATMAGAMMAPMSAPTTPPIQVSVNAEGGVQLGQ